MKNKNLNIESGRSMVEMLGVLAVMGVLSVAGIAGYTTAMRSYRTNEIVNAASMLYVMAMAQNAGNGPTGKVAYTDIEKTNPSGVSTLEYENNVISITFNDEKDCTMALNKLGDKAGDCIAATGSATGYSLTVTLGEVVDDPNADKILNNSDQDTLYPCTNGFWCWDDGPYGQVMECEDGEWRGIPFKCESPGRCKDAKVHSTKDGTCASGTATPIN